YCVYTFTISLSYLHFNMSTILILLFFFFFNDTATTEIYTLSLHDALPISNRLSRYHRHPPDESGHGCFQPMLVLLGRPRREGVRSEEHTSELQSRGHLVCRLLLEKKKKTI